jgi:hypothetical protein
VTSALGSSPDLKSTIAFLDERTANLNLTPAKFRRISNTSTAGLSWCLPQRNKIVHRCPYPE